jgi:type VI protein secretion system component VasF
MTLQQLVEPLFQYLCRLNRAHRAGAAADRDLTRRELTELFEQMRRQAARDPVLQESFRQMELPLLFFVDFTIAYSGLPFARDWRRDENRLAYSVGERGGDEKFLDLLDKALKPGSNVSPEQIAVYYTCMGLGFTGQPPLSGPELQMKMLQLAGRLRGSMDADVHSRVAPDAYHADTAPYARPPGSAFLKLAMLLVGLVLVLLVANIVLWRDSVRDLRDCILRVSEHAPQAETDSARGTSRETDTH